MLDAEVLPCSRMFILHIKAMSSLLVGKAWLVVGPPIGLTTRDTGLGDDKPCIT
jgi:hypothetical protein